jgi:hypothetical protein
MEQGCRYLIHVFDSKEGGNSKASIIKQREIDHFSSQEPFLARCKINRLLNRNQAVFRASYICSVIIYIIKLIIDWAYY